MVDVRRRSWSGAAAMAPRHRDRSIRPTDLRARHKRPAATPVTRSARWRSASAMAGGSPFTSRHLDGRATLRAVEVPRLPRSLDGVIREAAAMKAEARRVRAEARATCEWAKLAAEDARRMVVQARRPWRSFVR